MCFNHPTQPRFVVYSTDRSKGVVPGLVLLFVALRFILLGDLFSLALCYFVLVFFSPFSIVIASLGEERANLSAFRTFVRFAFVWFVCFLFLLVSGKGCGLWLWHSLDFSLTCFAFRDRSGYKDQCFFVFFFLFFFISNGWRFKQATHPIFGILVWYRNSLGNFCILLA